MVLISRIDSSKISHEYINTNGKIIIYFLFLINLKIKIKILFTYVSFKK